jgi:thiamine-monophosphate kinase
MSTLAEIGEEELVRCLTQQLRQGKDVVSGPGDDCAVIRLEQGGYQLLKTDAVVEGVHFLADENPHLIGRKALARAISDIAAMGGKPLHALVTVFTPKSERLQRLSAIYEGMQALAEQYGVSIVGGETTRSDVLKLNVCLTGVASQPVLRSTAKAGDVICVTGRLGGSIHGKHLRFTPRLAEGQWLAHHGLATAMMDLSDGLGSDLPRMAKASGLSYSVDMHALPCTPGCGAAAAWSDGEDYELLFTYSLSKWEQLRSSWPAEFPELTRIGQMVPLEQAPVASGAKGWDPFVR